MFEKDQKSIEEAIGRKLDKGELEIFNLCKDDERYNFFLSSTGVLEARATGFDPINRAGLPNPFFSPEQQAYEREKSPSAEQKAGKEQKR